MSLPKVSVAFSDGNLLKTIANADGFGGMVLTGAILLSTPQVIYNLQEAEDLGITAAAEAYAHRQIKEFYQEVGGNQKLHFMLVPETMTMEDMLDVTNPNGAIKLCLQTNREISLLAVGRNPNGGYDGGTDFIDSDVSAALTNSSTFGANRVADLNFLAVLIEARVQNPSAANTLTPTAIESDYGGALLGGSLNDGSASIGTALGRAVREGAHVKLGRVSDAPVSLTTVYIGDKLVKERTDLSTLHGEGFISFMQHPGKAGYYFGIDRMANTGDYSLLARRRVVNKAAVIATSVTIEEVEGDVDVEANGNIASHEIDQTREQIELQINNLMAGQISGVEAYINPAQDIINTSEYNVELGVQPKGYKSKINIGIGLKTSIG
jgi:hypothetical protein